jgi:hypothetical protein
MERLSVAQERFTSEVLNIQYDAADESVLSEAQLAENLAKIGVTDYTR